MDRWVILELSQKAEREDPDVIRKSIAYTVRGADVFIPAAVTQVGEDRVVHYLVEGYAFIRHRHEQSAYNRLENSRYVQTVLTTVTRPSGGRPVRQLAFVTDSDIERMRRQIHKETDQGIAVGDTVLITSGAYRQITAKIIEEIPEEDKVQVHVQLRSKDSIVTLPRSFLRLVTKAPRPAYIDQFDEVKAWFNDAAPALRLPAFPYNTQSLQEAQQRFLTLDAWADAIGPKSSFVRSFYTPLDFEAVAATARQATTLTVWTQRWETLSPLTRPALSTKALRAKYDELKWLVSVQQRLDGIRADVLAIDRQLDRKTAPMGYDNVLVDGYNLAFRVLYAPGMADLRDTKNRPSGVIYGFLRSIQALAKRFPGAQLTVCWDGSNRTRKARYADYKANRPAHPAPEPGAWDQVAWLREVLPLLGVTQAFNPEEEADDVIASLLRGRMAGARNLILSSDRDLLQLVTEADHLLCPAQGKRKETIFDPATLEAEWGVPPAQIVALRAMYGDSSDNLPGVPTVPEKVLVELLKLYGSLDGIFSSNLAGLTKLRYERLRAAEKQVRLNEEIMTLRTVPITTVLPTQDRKAATERLTDVDVDVDPLLAVLFGDTTT